MCTVVHMAKMLQVRNLPDDVHRTLKMRAGHLALLGRAWELRANVSFYDGLYVALAERLSLPLVTLDARLAKAPGIRASIEPLG